MEKLVESLKNLKNGLPANCTQSNLSKLHSALLEYKLLLNTLPANLQAVKTTYENNLLLLDFKLNTITDKINSHRDSKYYFKDALLHLHTEPDNIIGSLDIPHQSL
ncbi:MAG: hypothetical protein ABI813_07240 [Bacteroidota bacterium]